MACYTVPVKTRSVTRSGKTSGTPAADRFAVPAAGAKIPRAEKGAAAYEKDT